VFTDDDGGFNEVRHDKFAVALAADTEDGNLKVLLTRFVKKRVKSQQQPGVAAAEAEEEQGVVRALTVLLEHYHEVGHENAAHRHTDALRAGGLS
jgi:hypothetical protein